MKKATQWMCYVLFLIVLFWIFGCASPTKPTADQTTELGIQVYGLPVDINEVDTKTMEVEKCLVQNGFQTRNSYAKISLTVKLDRERNGHQDYKCEESWTGWCAGSRNGNNLVVTPNLAAYKHELIHWHGYAEQSGGAMVCS